jgi:5,5'-dehydrodivanillate O-demethylase oxygenase subunit
MLTREQNERLTKVGPGTPCGELLRRYWQALCPAAELTVEKPKKRIRIMGEDLVVFRKPHGGYGCVGERCPHRGASLYLGFVEPDGIRCCYHGWKYNSEGACLERPFEPDSPKDHIRIPGYPVQECGGLLFAYMGPDPLRAPLLPRWDVLAREDGPKKIVVFPVHDCNWLQVQENTVDSVHTYYLHGHYSAVNELPAVLGWAYFYRPIKSYDFAICDWGIEKTLVYGGNKPEIEVRPPLIFPNILRIPQGPVECLHFRVPIDDTHTRIIWIGLFPPNTLPPAPAGKVPFDYMPNNVTPEGEIDMANFYGQDRAVWETQGAIFDRSNEMLGKSDRGIALFRRMLAEQIDRVERGEDPTVAVVRDPANNVAIEFASHTQPWYPDGPGEVHHLLAAAKC